MSQPKPVLHIISSTATQQQLAEMAAFYGQHIKVAVDLKRGVLAGGGEWHADCEHALLADGSEQANIWGGGIKPRIGEVDYYALINIRPAQHNPDQYILSPKIREKFKAVVSARLGL